MAAFRPATLAGILLCSVALPVLTAAPLVAQTQTPATSPDEKPESTALETLIADYQAHVFKYSPDAAAQDEGRLASTWPDVSPETLQEKAEAEAALLARLDSLEDAPAIGSSAETDAAILRQILTDRVAIAALDEARVPFMGDSGFHSAPLYSISRAQIRTHDDAEALIARMSAIPAWLEQNTDNMKRGVETGYVAHVDPLATMIEQVRVQSETPPEESALFTPFREMPESLFADGPELRKQALDAIEQARIAYGDLATYLETSYRRVARTEPGISTLPGGEDAYAAMIAMHTTRTDLTPQQIHQIGQEEVARIRAEMDAIIEDVAFAGSFAEFLAFLRTDPQFYAETPDELMMHAARMAKDLDGKMPEFFGTLPRLSYGVEPVPEEIAPGYTTGRYVPGDPDRGKAGFYWVNTHALDQRPLYELPALTAHEGVPGHHHQIALAQEMEDLSPFRRDYYATAFGEGWGLYSESLADEMGLYKTPYEKFGKLSYEMWRACRLVADTGLHDLGWSRAEAEACFTDNSALAPLNIKTEVTRYIGWPGQATAYKIGELTIKDLRAKAEAALGEDFDIRRFHDAVLAEGSVPLDLLETRIAAWIEAEQAE